MAEKQNAFVEVNVIYECDSGDGGVLMVDENPKIDNQGGTVFLHRCSNPKDKQAYLLKTKYPRTVMVAVNISGILAGGP